MIKNSLNLKLKTQQSLVLTLAMQQAIHILQLPVTELALWLQFQIEQNPALQFDETPLDDYCTELDFEAQGFEVLDHLDESFIQGAFPDEPIEEPSPENLTPATISLHEHLMLQARSVFHVAEELAHAEQIIGSLDHKGFLEEFEADPQILHVIQLFDPPGIAARNLQECLIIQLRLLHKEKTLAYELIENHFDDILRCRLSQVAKKLQVTVTAIQTALKRDISPLDFYPGAKFRATNTSAVIPDIVIEQAGSNLVVRINDAPLPRFTLAPPSPFLSNFYSEAKWVETILARRCDILKKIVDYLLEKHYGFFTGSTSNIEPCSMQEISLHLGLNESTIARAVKEKYIYCPRGIFPLRHFFPHVSATSDKGKEVSHIDAKQLLKHLIDNEDKSRPLSDNALALAMAQAGIPCARRTIAKYRQSLNIPTASLRKDFFSL
jgi:RNA polymerase sigma-54 factor